MRNPGRLVALGALALILVLAIAGWLLLADKSSQAVPWMGVDASVIERYAIEAGREIQQPIINTNQGDLLLFVFAASGAVGGFIAGYYWRQLISERKTGNKD